jgi:hypothetical protein
MNHRRTAHIGSALALASLAGCNKPPEPPPPAFHSVIASSDSRLGFNSFARDMDASLEPAADDRPRKGNAFGAGIRPGRGASGIVP